MTDSPPLLANLAVLVQLLSKGHDAGLPLPTTVASASDLEAVLQWADSADASLWAEYLDLQLEDYVTISHLHSGAVTTIDGVTVRLAACRRLEVSAV